MDRISKIRRDYLTSRAHFVLEERQIHVAAPILCRVRPQTSRLRLSSERRVAGFSMTEMLVVVLLLGLMTGLVAGVMSSMNSTYKKIQVYANAENLCNMVLTRIVTELRDSTDLTTKTVDNTETIIFVSHSGTMYDDQYIGFPKDTTTTEKAGEVQVQTYTNELTKFNNPVNFLPSAVYTDDMTVGVKFDISTNSDTDISTNSDTNLVTVQVIVYYGGDELTEASRSVAVKSFLATSE